MSESLVRERSVKQEKAGFCVGQCGRHITQFEPNATHYVRSEGLNPLVVFVLCERDYEMLALSERAIWRRTGVEV